jgi:hypothetical protein
MLDGLPEHIDHWSMEGARIRDDVLVPLDTPSPLLRCQGWVDGGQPTLNNFSPFNTSTRSIHHVTRLLVAYYS